MGYERNKADPCMYFQWTPTGLVIWTSWIDDCMIWGKKKQVLNEKNKFMKRFDCEDIGALKEYVGCKIDRNHKERSIRFTQPIMLQSFKDEFNVMTANMRVTPADPGTILAKAEEDQIVSKHEHTHYRAGVGKLLHMTRWSRPETQNAVRELSRHDSAPNEAHMKAMKRCMRYCVGTPKRGWFLKPNRQWNGKDKSFKFRISGESDSDYAKCPVTRRSVSGYSTFLEGAPVTVKSAMQRMVALSVLEAEAFAAVSYAQDILYVMRIIQALDLKVKFANDFEG